MKMKKIRIVIISVLLVIALAGFAKDAVIKIAVENAVGFATGLKLHIGSFRMGVLNTVVDIKDMKLYSPKGFKDRVMADIPEIYVDYSISSLFKNKMHLRKLRIALKELVVVRNEKGQLNLDSLKVVQTSKEGKKAKEAPARKAPEIQIDVLELQLGRALYKDYSAGGDPAIKEFNVNTDERYTNVNNLYSVVSLIIVRTLRNTTIASIANFDIQGLQGTISAHLMGAQKTATQAVEKAKETAKSAAKEAADKLQLILGKT